jgi:hypothetical protein
MKDVKEVEEGQDVKGSRTNLLAADVANRTFRSFTSLLLPLPKLPLSPLLPLQAAQHPRWRKPRKIAERVAETAHSR